MTAARRSRPPQSSVPAEDSQASSASSHSSGHVRQLFWTSYRAAELLYKPSLVKKYLSSLDHKPDTFFSSSSCCGRFIEWNNTGFTFTLAFMNIYIVLTVLLNSSYTPVRVTARPSSLWAFNMIKDFKHYHKLFVLDRPLHFLLKYGNDTGRETLRSVQSVNFKVVRWYCAVCK